MIRWKMSLAYDIVCVEEALEPTIEHAPRSVRTYTMYDSESNYRSRTSGVLGDAFNGIYKVGGFPYLSRHSTASLQA